MAWICKNKILEIKNSHQQQINSRLIMLRFFRSGVRSLYPDFLAETATPTIP